MHSIPNDWPRSGLEPWVTRRNLGAKVVREEFYDDVLGHVVMLDPEGNEFCVA